MPPVGAAFEQPKSIENGKNAKNKIARIVSMFLVLTRVDTVAVAEIARIQAKSVRWNSKQKFSGELNG
jgi:hypothetical protein